jgi:hypothetical protein
LSMVVCTDQGETIISVDAAGNPVPKAPGDHASDLCPWSVTAQDSILTPAAAPAIPAAMTAVATICVTDLVAAVAPCRTSAPRGPPILL